MHHKTMLLKIFRYLLIPILFLLLFGIYLLLYSGNLQTFYYTVFPKQCTVTSDPIAIENAVYNRANDFQNGATVWMGTDHGKLFFQPHYYYDASEQTRYYNYLSVFENGGATRLAKLDGVAVGMKDGYVYFSKVSGFDSVIKDEGIYCYQISSQTTSRLSDEWAAGFVASDGNICFISSSTNTVTKYVQGEPFSTTSQEQSEYTLGERVYTPETINGSETVILTDSSGASTDLGDVVGRGQKNLLLCDQGLVVHNVRNGKALYLICPDGNIVTLFEADCSSARSTINQYGNWIFLSFLRYRYSEEADAHVPYENDELSGTFRINLLDYSCEKISNQFYSGLYIFDDSGIYACDDNCHIYKLDFDGNITRILME